ncbi:hypothetical protein IP90_01113 [Luteimonas cucumeris]|uniref:Uncharacterized protein n=1 Tax=Luteimonas cucumeris TaxID=985012 RepID=A0A562LBG2_9GAMM|nr:hypothetical protein [Luteimonas cucumeris]TWI04971.1 hypothetical protein IP90_01113 [Luteimonas cucumeris]
MEKWRRRRLKTFGFWAMYLASLAAVAAGPAAVGARPFPRQFTSGGTALTLYQPQLDSWRGTQLEGRFAMSVKTGTHAGADGKAVDKLTTPPDSLKQVLAVGRCTYAPIPPN